MVVSRLGPLLTLMLLGLLVAGWSQGAESIEDAARRAHAFSSTLMSPFCPGRTLTDCPSPSATALRGEIRLMLAQGVEEDSIRDQMRARYGDIVMSVPSSAWGWLLPVAILVGGVFVLVYALRRLSVGSPRSEGAFPEETAEIEAEIDREIQDQGL